MTLGMFGVGFEAKSAGCRSKRQASMSHDAQTVPAFTQVPFLELPELPGSGFDKVRGDGGRRDAKGGCGIDDRLEGIAGPICHGPWFGGA